MKSKSKGSRDIKIESDPLIGCNLPKGYFVTEFNGETVGICGAIESLSYDKEGNPIVTKICDCKVMVTGYYQSFDSGRDIIEVQFTAPDTNARKSEWRTIYVTLETIKTKKGVEGGLIPQGIAVEPKQIDMLISYLTACINVNMGVEDSTFKIGQVFDINGWKDDNYTTFVSGTRLFREVNIDGRLQFTEHECIFTDSENTDCIKKLATMGNVEGWVESVKPVIKFPRVRFACYKELDILLVKMLGSKPCTIGYIGFTSIGKTMTEQIASSHIGNPDETKGLIITGDISITALHANLRAYSDHTVHVDETTNMKEEVKKVIGYIATNGQEPERAKRDGKLRGQTPLCSNVMVTSENEIISDRTSDGAEIRSIIVTKPPMDELDQLVVRKIDNGIKHNYGHILIRFLNKISEHRSELHDLYEASITRLQSKTPNIQTKRQASYYAVAEVAGKLLEEIYQEIGIPPVNPSEIVDQMWFECVSNNMSKPLHIKALESVYSFYISNSHKHFVNGNDKPTPGMGDIYGWDLHEYIDFDADTLKQALRKDNFDKINSILKLWQANGIIETNTTALVKTARHFKDMTSEEATLMGIYRIMKAKIRECLNLDDLEKPLTASEWRQFDDMIENMLATPIDQIEGEFADW